MILNPENADNYLLSLARTWTDTDKTNDLERFVYLDFSRPATTQVQVLEISQLDNARDGRHVFKFMLQGRTT